MNDVVLARLEHPGQVRMLWSVEFYDGVLSGVADFDGRLHWFACLQPDRYHRVFHVFSLTADEAEMELRTHRLFREHVGEHTDYVYDETTGAARRKLGALRPQAQWAKFYDRPAQLSPRAPYADGQAVGWFELSASPHRRRIRSVRYWSRIDSVL